MRTKDDARHAYSRGDGIMLKSIATITLKKKEKQRFAAVKILTFWS